MCCCRRGVGEGGLIGTFDKLALKFTATYGDGMWSVNSLQLPEGGSVWTKCVLGSERCDDRIRRGMNPSHQTARRVIFNGQRELGRRETDARRLAFVRISISDASRTIL